MFHRGNLPIEAPWSAGGPLRVGWANRRIVETPARSRKRRARLFLDIVVRAVFTSEPRDLSFLYFLSYLKSGHGLESLISIKGGAQESRFVGSAQRTVEPAWPNSSANASCSIAPCGRLRRMPTA